MKNIFLFLFILSYHSLLLPSQNSLFAGLREGLLSSTISQDPLFSSLQDPLALFPESLLTPSSEDQFILPFESQQPPIPHQNFLPPFFNDQQESASPKYITYVRRIFDIGKILPLKEEFIFFNNFIFTAQEITALNKSAISFNKPFLSSYHGTFEEKKEQLVDLLNSYTHKQEAVCTIQITQLPLHAYKVEIFNQSNGQRRTILVSGD